MVTLLRSIPSLRAASRRVYMPPRAVASDRPGDPPKDKGLPVMTPNWLLPMMDEYSSSIQAMIWGLV